MNNRIAALFIFLVLVISGSLAGKYFLSKSRHLSDQATSPSFSQEPLPGYHQRIISMAPNITEILFSLGLGDRVVGVTRFCDYPPEALTLPRIGGYYDPHYEEIVQLQPDLVILLESQKEQKDYLGALELKTLTVDNQTIFEILKSIVTIGEACGKAKEAREVVSALQADLDTIHDKTKGLPRPLVMVSVGRTLGTGSLEDVYIAGNKGFYDEMITLAGGENVYKGKNIKFPLLSAEGILSLNPDIIIDMVPELEAHGLKEGSILREWAVVSQVNAVKNERVYVLSQDFVVIPGPRSILILKAMAQAIHPEVDW